jgi:pyrroloquinoline quinone biosynthesis protein B
MLNKLLLASTLLLLACAPQKPAPKSPKPQTTVQLIILGTVQDAGSPHMGCRKLCCKDLFDQEDTSRKVVSLGIVDFEEEKNSLFEATPDIVSQAKKLKRAAPFAQKETPDGVFLTHAHIGHYAGLMYLGREALGADQVPVYAMPRMRAFLQSNGPWDQLVSLKNIDLQSLKADSTVQAGGKLKVTPFLVPHRDEYSETVGFRIQGPSKSALFIPDIDKWSKWEMDIVTAIASVDYAFLDATFFDGEEINHRDISQIPHPFIVESMALFADLPTQEKAKVHFIHLNHTNPALDSNSKQYQKILNAGFRVASFGETFVL